MPSLDLFIYRDFDSLHEKLEIGDDAERKLGSGFNGLHVVAIGPPIHDGKDETIVLAAERRPDFMQRLKGFFGPRSDQILEPQIQVVPLFLNVGGSPSGVGLRATGTGVSDTTERTRTYALGLDQAEDLARQLMGTAEHVRAQIAKN